MALARRGAWHNTYAPPLTYILDRSSLAGAYLVSRVGARGSRSEQESVIVRQMGVAFPVGDKSVSRMKLHGPTGTQDSRTPRMQYSQSSYGDKDSEWQEHATTATTATTKIKLAALPSPPVPACAHAPCHA